MGNDNPIYRWLSSVESHEQSGRQDRAKTQEQVKDTTATSIPRTRIPLERSESVCGNAHPASRKRNSGYLDETKASSAQKAIPGNESQKRSRHSYEIRPRHKTREDRYEYKGPSSAVETHRKGRAKKSRGRRHTMNDDFHASNVTGNRLTLRSNPNLGIFSKGRSSSTTTHHGNTPSTALAKLTPSAKSHKHTAESDLAFFEMKFLSRRNNLSPYPPSTARNTLDGQYEREYNPQEQHLDDPAHESKLDLSHTRSKSLDVRHQLDSSVTPLFTFEEAPVSKISPVSSHSRGGSPEPPNKRRKTSKKSSSIPHTWTETEVENTEQKHPLEQRLLNLLLVGVYPQALCSEITNTVLARRYWSLAELWALLEERKAWWSKEAGNRMRASPEANTEQLAPVGAEATAQEVSKVMAPDHLELANVGTIQNEMPKHSPDSNAACEPACSVNNGLPQQPSVLAQQQDGICQASDKPGSLDPQAANTSNQDLFIDILNDNQCEVLPQESTEDEVLFPASVPEVEQPHMSEIDVYELDRVDDDDVFYRTLDAAYRAIVSSRAAAEVASGLQQSLESHALSGTDLPSSPKSTGFWDSDIPTRQVEAREPDCLATVSQEIMQERLDERPPGPSCQQNLPTSCLDDPCVEQENDLPWLTAGYGQSQLRMSTEFNARQSQPPELSDFWRQNKLY